MDSKERPIYLTAEQLEELAAERTGEAEKMPPGEARRHALSNVAQLRSFAAMKRHLALKRPNEGVVAKGMFDVGN